MQIVRTERNSKRTVRRNRRRGLLAVLFFLLLPYVSSLLLQPPETAKQQTTEEFMVGALAAVIPGHYQKETIKAQAVILRSIAGKEGKDAMAYLDEAGRKVLWEQDFETNEEKFWQAARETAGIVLEKEGEKINPPYFRISAGKTREGNEIWPDGRFSWCKSVDCPYNLEAEDYLQKVCVKKSVFLRKMSQLGVVAEEKPIELILTRDSAGYVLFLTCAGQYLEGERFREIFGLPSSCFWVSVQDKEVVFTTRGMGHGLGFDQYGANLLAGSGMDYQELLYVFFDGVTLEKVE